MRPYREREPNVSDPECSSDPISAGRYLGADRGQLRSLSFSNQPEHGRTRIVPDAVRFDSGAVFRWRLRPRGRRLLTLYHQHLPARRLAASDPEHVDALAVRTGGGRPAG